MLFKEALNSALALSGKDSNLLWQGYPRQCDQVWEQNVHEDAAVALHLDFSLQSTNGMQTAAKDSQKSPREWQHTARRN